MEFTTHLELHSQTTRLLEIWDEGVEGVHGAVTLCGATFQWT